MPGRPGWQERSRTIVDNRFVPDAHITGEFSPEAALAAGVRRIEDQLWQRVDLKAFRYDGLVR